MPTFVFYIGHSKANTCAKPEPLWEQKDQGKEIFQGKNSRVG